MSVAQDIADAMAAKISMILMPEGFKRIPNSYDVLDNPALYLVKGYGIEIGAGQNTKRYVGCLSTWSRDYTIILIRQVVTTENNTAVRFSLEKYILDNHENIFKAFEIDASLGGIATVVSVESDGGIVFLDIDQQKYLAMSIQISIEYQLDPRS